MLDKLILTPLHLVSAITNIMRGTEAATASGGSLIGYVKSTRVEPLVLIDQAAQHLPYIEDILKAHLAIFSAYYLQAVSLSVNVGKINVAKLFDHLNPDRSAPSTSDMILKGINSFESAALVTESNYRRGLPKLRVTPDNTGLEAIILSDDDEDRIGKTGDEIDARTGNKPSWSGVGEASNAKAGAKGLNAVTEEGNLVVGNLLQVEIEHDKQKATIPISIRLVANPMRSDVLAHILSRNERDLSIKERIHELYSGQIKFFKDLVMCQDLIDEHRSTLMKDKSNQYAEILKRRQNNRKAAWVSKKPSVADASNIVIMTEGTRNAVEANCGGRLKDFRTRERIFDATYLMIMAVIDTQFETVTIYHRGIALPTVASVKAMKLNGKKSSTDIGEILKAYQLGNTPTF